MPKKKSFLRGLMATETRALIVGAALLITGVLLGVSGITDQDLALIFAGSVLTLVSIYTTTSAFIRYQWDTFVEDIRQMHDMGKIATADYLRDLEAKKEERDDNA